MKHNFLIFFEFVKKLYLNRYMIRLIVGRELRQRYVGSMFGFLWAVLNPLGQLVIYGIVFGIFFKLKPSPAYGTESFLLFLICGLVPWQFFSETLGRSAMVLLDHGNIIKKSVRFPSEILPFVTVMTNTINHLIGVSLLFAVVLAFHGKLTMYSPLVFVYLFILMMFLIGAGWILSSINLYLRDIEQLLILAITGLLFLTPLFYSHSIVPSGILPFLKLNPMFYVVEGYRLALLAGNPLPLSDMLYFIIISLATFAGGGLLFRKLKPGFAEAL